MSDYDGILQEDMNDKLDTILEYLDGLRDVPQRLTKLEHSMGEVKGELKMFRVLLRDHETRITKLETT